MFKINLKFYLLFVVFVLVSSFSWAIDASYFRQNTDEDWEKAERVARHADIVVRPDCGGELVFWRGTSYLPYWKTDSGKWSLDELIHRTGDGPKTRPDSICRFASARLIEDTPARAVVHYRYLPDFSKKDFKDFADEYFTVYPDGRCVRIVRRPSEKLDDWNDQAKLIIQNLKLSSQGIAKIVRTKKTLLRLKKSSKSKYDNLGFDIKRGSCVVKCRRNSAPSELTFILLADNGIKNPAILVKNWGDSNVRIYVDGRKLQDFRIGYINRAKGIDMIIWLPVESPENVEVSIKPLGSNSIKNTAPLVNAGNDQTVTVGADSPKPYLIRLSANVEDDGLPADKLKISWKKTSGPGQVNFTNSLNAGTDVRFSQCGTYQLKLTAEDGQLSGQDEVIIVIKKDTPAIVEPAAWWKFDEGSGDIAVETVSMSTDIIAGNKTLRAAGINGRALVCDGYNTVVNHAASSAPAVRGALTIEAWIAVKAYPWNWCPIIHQSKWQKAGYFLGVDAYGHVGMKVYADGKWFEATSTSVVKRNKWYYIAGTFDSSARMMKVYINGTQAASIDIPDGDITLAHDDIKIAKGRNMLPTDRIRENVGGTPDSFAFDGLIDDVKLYTSAMTSPQIAQSYNADKPDKIAEYNPDLQDRVLPAGGTDKAHKFGAYYQTLKFYDTWDNMWRLSEDADVVVQFDQLPYKFVFWHGTSYVPNWVSEKNKWSGSEFLETAKGGIEGCGEPMSDKKCRHSVVHIIENNDARVVIHWRYGMPDVHDKFAYVDQFDWGDWGQEYHYIYPDGTSIRRQTLWSNALNEWHEWQEAIVVNGPETRPEDNIEFDAVHMANINGEKEIYTWEHGLPKQLHGEDMRYPEGAHIHLVNLKSQWDHFSIFEQRSLYKEPECYDGELTKASHFPWWNHWPVSQVTSDGRWAYEPDRTSHSSFDNFKWKPTYRTQRSATRLLMQGMTDQDILSLVPLAKAWENPPVITINTDNFTGGEFVRGQKAYQFKKHSANTAKLEFTMAGSEESPIINPCFIIENWNPNKLDLNVDDHKIERGPDFRWAVETNARGTHTLIIWINVTAQSNTVFKMNAD